MKRQRWLKSYPVCSLFIIASLLFLGIPTRLFSGQPELTYPKVLRFASLSAGSMTYAYTSGLAKVASDNTPMTLMVIPTSGATAWLPMLSELGSIDLAAENLSSCWQMWTGKVAPEPVPKGFASKPPYVGSKNIRLLVAGPSTFVGMLVRKESGMREIGNLRGKTIAWDWTAMPTLIALTLANLHNGGLTVDDVRTIPVTEVIAGVRAVQERRIDATTCGVGMSAVAEADTLVGVRYLRNSMDPERIKAGQRCMPGGSVTIVRGGQPGVPEDTPIWGVPIGVLVSTRMPDHVAYKLVETWWGHHKEYASIHPILKEWIPATFTNKNFTVPYHNGAIQFYKEQGVWSPEMEKIQNQILKGE